MSKLFGQRSGGPADGIRGRGLALVRGECQRLGGAGGDHGQGIRAVGSAWNSADAMDQRDGLD